MRFYEGIIFMLLIPSAHAAVEFEVASIRLNTSGSGSSSSNGSQGEVVIKNMPLKRLIGQAFDVKPFQVNGPAWMDDVRFDITAKNPAGATPADRPEMLRRLLEDRFHLTVHRTSKDMPGYALVVAKSGFKLKPVEDDENHDSNNSGGVVRSLRAKEISMTALADFISRQMDGMVINETKIEGVYDLELKWNNDPLKPTDETAPALPAALEETLGLRLEPRKVPVEVIVVDQVDRLPTDN